MIGLSGPEADGSIHNPNLSQPPICEWKPMVPPLFKSGRGEGSTQTILAGLQQQKKFHVKGSASSNGSGGDGGRPSPAFLLALTMALELTTGHFNMIPENQKQ